MRQQYLHRSGWVVLMLVCLVTAQDRPPASQSKGGVATLETKSLLSQGELPTTDGAIALSNLQAQIAAEERLASYGSLTVSQRAAIVELLIMRGQFLGRIADYEHAETLAEQLLGDASNDGRAFLARAQARVTLHRFAEALADLAEAERLGVNSDRCAAVRATIFQASGRYDEALAIRQHLTQVRPDIRSLGAEAAVRAERGEIDEAERLFAKAQQQYRDVSPFPVVWLYFQQGLMWMWEDNLERARVAFEAACARLPGYAAAQGHLAMVEAALARRERTMAVFQRWMQEGDLEQAREGSQVLHTGEDAAVGRYERAIALLRRQAHSSDDPEYASQLARLLKEVGQLDEAQHWREVAAARYDELMARHPEAFADHAADFWLTVGGDAQKGRLLAEQNFEIRKTPRAYELVLQAAVATQETAAVCSVTEHLRAVDQMGPRLRALAVRAATTCRRLSPPSKGHE
jgi:tetratricopeptide (TPR) repeat protein